MSDHESPEEDFERLADLARSITPEDRLRQEPPPGLWDQIAQRIEDGAIDDEAESEAIEHGASEDDAALIDLSERRTEAPATTYDEPASADLTETSGFSPSLLLVAAAALLIVVLGASFFLADGGSNSNVIYAGDISNADLPEAFDGTASVVVEIDDAPMIEISFNDELPSDQLVEVWIMRADLSAWETVGLVEDGVTTWDWPAGFSPEEYPLIDISIEPDDGDPSHSGRSILRGELTVS